MTLFTLSVSLVRGASLGLRQSQADFEAAEREAEKFEKNQPKDRPMLEIRSDFNETLRLILGILAWKANRGDDADAAQRFTVIRGDLVAMRANVRRRETRGGGETNRNERV